MATDPAYYLAECKTLPVIILTRPANIVARRTEVLYAQQPLPTLLHDALQVERWHVAGMRLPPPFPLWEARPVGVEGMRLVGDVRCPAGRAPYRLDIGAKTRTDIHLSFLQSFILDIHGSVTWLWQCVNDPKWEI